MISWILALNRRKKVAVYCSDVSGASDRVRAERLPEKLRCKGVHPASVDLARSWLLTTSTGSGNSNTMPASTPSCRRPRNVKPSCTSGVKRTRSRTALRRRTVGTRRPLQGTSLQRFSSSRDGFRLGKTHSAAQATRRTNTSKYDAWQYNSGYEKRLSVSRVDMKNNTADLFTKHLDGLRTQSLAKKLGLRILDGTNGTNGDD